MAVFTIVSKSHLEKTSRIDSEFYQPEYILSFERLLRTTPIRLSRIANVGDGNHLKIAEQFQDTPGIRYLRGQDVSTDMMLEDRNEIYIPENFHERIKRGHIYKNDILVTIVGANTGLVALAYDIPERLSASCKLGIARPKSVKAGYLYAFLVSRYGQHQIRRNKRGGGQTGLILPDISNCPQWTREGKTIERSIFPSRATPTFRTWFAKLEPVAHAVVCPKLQPSNTEATHGRRAFSAEIR
jgi:type I restriction enzyme S subunit